MSSSSYTNRACITLPRQEGWSASCCPLLQSSSFHHSTHRVTPPLLSRHSLPFLRRPLPSPPHPSFPYRRAPRDHGRLDIKQENTHHYAIIRGSCKKKRVFPTGADCCWMYRHAVSQCHQKTTDMKVKAKARLGALLGQREGGWGSVKLP